MLPVNEKLEIVGRESSGGLHMKTDYHCPWPGCRATIRQVLDLEHDVRKQQRLLEAALERHLNDAHPGWTWERLNLYGQQARARQLG